MANIAPEPKTVDQQIYLEIPAEGRTQNLA
jgi:hypothetical protein